MSKKIDPDRMISPSEYAKLIGKSKALVTKMMNEGKVEVINFKGGRIILLPKKK